MKKNKPVSKQNLFDALKTNTSINASKDDELPGSPLQKLNIGTSKMPQIIFYFHQRHGFGNPL